MGKGEIAFYEQCLLFPQCFQKAYFPGASKGVIVWEWVNPHLLISGLGSKSLHLAGLDILILILVLTGKLLNSISDRFENLITK